MSPIKTLRNAFFVLGLLWTLPAHAGIPVIDVASITQAIAQVEAWGKQNIQMAEQIKQAISQVQQMTTMTAKLDGMRGLGTILNDPAINASLPPVMRDAANMLSNPSAASNNPAALAALLKSFGVSTSTDPKAGISNADGLLNMQGIMSSAQQRQSQLNRLAERVDSSADAKESLDLLNRNTIEAATINNQVLQTMATIEASRQAETLAQVAREQAFKKAQREALVGR